MFKIISTKHYDELKNYKFKYNTLTSILQHNEAAEAKAKEHTCGWCGLVCKNEAGLHRHYALVHRKKK